MKEEEEIDETGEEEEMEDEEVKEMMEEKSGRGEEEEEIEKKYTKPKREKKERGGEDSNVVFIGKKGIMSYVLAVVTQFNNGEREVVIKARGRAISRAVDVAEIVRQRFVRDVEPKKIDISTEEIEGEEGIIKVSAIEITLAK